MKPELKNVECAENACLNEKIRAISLCLHQLEQECKGYGFNFSALLIRASALSFSWPPKEQSVGRERA